MRHALKLILVPLALLLSARCAVSQAGVDAEGRRLNGTIRSVRVEYASLFDHGSRKIEGQRIPQTETFYNVEGRVIERVYFNADGTVGRKTGHTYDEDGRLAEMISYDPDGTAALRRTYAYDGANRKTEEADYKHDGSISIKRTYTYNADGPLPRRSEYVYNDRGRIASRIDYSPDGSREGRFLYEYNSAGKLKKIVKGDTGIFYCNEIIAEEKPMPVEYDAYGNWTKSVGAGFVTYRTITYH